MASPNIELHGVWKKFRRGELHDSLRDLLPALARRIAHGRRPAELEADQFWALRDVSFTVRPGETLGIIGANGAGKSTTLKILSRILRPDLGSCSVPERCGTLIEISAGFHPDLSGRENIYLQGAILGMSRAETARKFDEIVAFSGLESFIDTPVKRYSSGMSARLGFSIAAHLDPDALLIDEVLAVGDYAFQQKAFGRIAEMAKRNIPVIVVSHQLERIASLCSHTILLEAGAVACSGSAAECISTYISRQTPPEPATADSPVRIDFADLTPSNTVRSGERIQLRIGATSSIQAVLGDSPDDIGIGIRLRELTGGRPISTVGTAHHGIALPAAGTFALDADLQMNVPAGIYSLETIVWNRTRGHEVSRGPAVTVQVDPGIPFVGTVQLNPQVELRVRSAATIAGLHA